MPSGIDVDANGFAKPMSMEAAAAAIANESSQSNMNYTTESAMAEVSPSSNQDTFSKAAASATEESVEVVLNDEGTAKVVEEKPANDQNVFRPPQSRERARPMRTPGIGGPPSMLQSHAYPYGHGSGSWGYAPPIPPDAYRAPPHLQPPPRHIPTPYPVPYYPNSSGSFDDHSTYPKNYSPHIQYPGPRYQTGEEVNVISPNHKTDPHGPMTPRRGPPPSYYQYPPTSPVSRTGQRAAPRMRGYAMRRAEGAYTRAQRPDYEGGPWNAYAPQSAPHPASTSSAMSQSKSSSNVQPPLVADSFDSHQSRTSSSHPDTPKGSPSKQPMNTPSGDPHVQFYGGGSWGSFDSAHNYDDQRYQGFPPDSPYSPYQQLYSPGGLYNADSFPSPHMGYGPPPLPPSFSYGSYDEEERLLRDYHPEYDGSEKYVTPPGQAGMNRRSKSSTPISSNTSSRNMLLPQAAQEVDFDIADPPTNPVTPESMEPICRSMSDVNAYDVLCGRGGGTNSQIGNRHFRQLVQEFQPTYLVAKRKEKPLLGRSIVLIIRKRGGRFLKKNEETGELFEVGDTKAEAKTSQALREGLDVRATRSAATAMSKKQSKKSKKDKSPTKEQEEESTTRAESPPPLPKLQGVEVQPGEVHPHSPDQATLRKRRRIRSAERFVNDFMPPRAEINRPDEEHDDGVLDDGNTTPIRRNGTKDESEADCGTAAGCAGIALDIVTGAATGSFCLGPRGGWSREGN